jgi:hypothetical protein
MMGPMTKKIQIMTPKQHSAAIGNLPFKANKLLRDSPKVHQAAKYALYRCFLAKHVYKDDLADEDEIGWTPLWSQLMGSIAGNNKQWALAKTALINAGYLECDNKCKRGTKSYCFRLGPVLEDADWDTSPDELTLPEDLRPKMEWLTIDEAQAHLIIDELAAEKNWDSRVTKGWHTRVKNFSPHFKICKTGRAYSDANQLPKRARNTLLIDGEPTAEIDIVNCQPMLLATIYPTQSEEWRCYKELAEKGLVYEELARFANLNRSEAKEVLIPFIFGSPKPIAEKFLMAKFPELLEAIKECRSRHYKALAFDLQRKESGIIVERVCDQFKAASIHDGVRVKVSDAETVKAFIESTFRELWQLSPLLTIEFIGQSTEPKAA